MFHNLKVGQHVWYNWHGKLVKGKIKRILKGVIEVE